MVIIFYSQSEKFTLFIHHPITITSSSFTNPFNNNLYFVLHPYFNVLYITQRREGTANQIKDWQRLEESACIQVMLHMGLW